jgi:hypothetical protein
MNEKERRIVAYGEEKNLVAWSAIPSGFPHQYYRGISWECLLCGGHYYSQGEIKRHLEKELIDLLNRLPPNLREKVWSWPYTEYPEYRSYSLKRVNTPSP